MPNNEFLGNGSNRTIDQFFHQIGVTSQLKLSDIPSSFFIGQGTDSHVYRQEDKAIKIYRGHFELCASGNYDYSRRVHEQQLLMYMQITNDLADYFYANDVSLPGHSDCPHRVAVNRIDAMEWRKEVGYMVAVSPFIDGSPLMEQYGEEVNYSDQMMIIRDLRTLGVQMMNIAHYDGLHLSPANIKKTSIDTIACAIITDVCTSIGALHKRAES